MSVDPNRVRAVITELLAAVDKSVDDVNDEVGLYAEGLELDSVEAAELSARLEDEFGSDPFSAALAAGDGVPETVGDVVAFYEDASRA